MNKNKNKIVEIIFTKPNMIIVVFIFLLFIWFVLSYIFGLFSEISVNNTFAIVISLGALFLSSVWLFFLYIKHQNKIFEDRQNKLQARQKFNHFLFNLSPAGMMIKDKNGNILDANEHYCKLFDYSLKELLSMNVKDFIDQSVKPDIKENIGKALEGITLEYTVPTVKKDGSVIYIKLSERRIQLPNGDSGILVVAYDTTKRMLMMEEINEKEKLLEAFFDQSLDGFYIMLLDEPVFWNKNNTSKKLFRHIMENEKIVKVNTALLKQYQVSKEELLGKKHIEMFENIIEIGEEYWRELFDDGKTHIVMSFQNAEGEEIWIEGDYICLIDESGRIKGHFGIQRDITEKINAENELISAKIRAEKSDELKSEFLAQMSHEIRTPINTILSYSSMIRSELEFEVPNDLGYGFESISKAGRRITRTVDLLINMSELQVGSYQPKFERIDICNDLLTKIYNEFKLDANEKGLNFKLSKDGNSVYTKCDSHSVEQVIANLVDNAIKYTSDGEVNLRLFRNKMKKIVLEVIDTGIGISDEFKENVFDIFTQEDRGYTRKYEGNGLGLSLVKRYCDMNNIDIKLKSKKGEGTTFTLTFL